jgi:hypothetical protein
MEGQLRNRILGEQLNKFKRKNNQIDMKNQKFDDYKNAIMSMINENFAAD